MAKKIKFYFLKLSLICIIVFVMQIFIPGFTELFVLNQKVLEGEIWRYLTAVFLHGGVVHLFYNLIALLFFGFTLERVIGSNRFLAVFLSSGILANVIAVNFYDSSLGASGAIYGILGMITVLKPFMIVWAFGLLMPMFIAAILWTIGDILGAFGFGAQNVGNIAHLSGIGVGVLIGILFKDKRRVKKDKITIPDNFVKSWEERYMGD